MSPPARFAPPPPLVIALLMVALMAAAPHRSRACPPEVCQCKWKGGKQTVECGASGGQLADLPAGMDPGTQVLNFSGNALQSLRAERFLKMDLIHLQKIYLCRNQITRINDKAFAGLSNLVELDLADNLLSAVPSATFPDYAALMRLTLSGNPIRQLHTSAFRHLAQLSTLELTNCQIELIEDGAFLGMEQLEWLRLDGNRVGTIRGQHVLPKTLHGINLHGNRWNCDCRMTELHAWLVNYNVPQQLEDPQCVYPARLKGETIKYLKAEQLACMPDITPRSFALELLEGHNVSLHCDVVAIPEATITWWFQGQQLQNDSLFETSLQLVYFVEDSGLPMVASGSGSGGGGGAEKRRSELYLYNTRLEHNGTFTCAAENSAGRTQTNYTIRVHRKEQPQPEKVVVPYRYMLAALVAAGATGFACVLLCCCVAMRCYRGSKRRRRRESAKDSTVQLQTSKCSSIISDGTQAPMPILKANGSAMMMGGGSGGGAVGATGSAAGSAGQEMLYMSASVSGSNGAQLQQLQQQHPHQMQQQMMQQHQQLQQQQQQHHNELGLTSPGQYCTPPVSSRSYSHEPNPDLINEAESNNKKCRQQLQQLDNDDIGSEHGASNSSVQGSSHMSCENGYHPVPVKSASMHPMPATTASSAPTAATPTPTPTPQSLKHPAPATVPRFNPLATLPRGIIKDLYQHQVDVHLNPGYFLGGQDGYPVEYRMHQPPSHLMAQHQQQQMLQQQHQHHLHHHQTHNQPMAVAANNQVNYYRTLPHKPKQHSGGAVAIPRYSMEAEFLQRTPPPPTSATATAAGMGPPPFDAYTLRDMRYTAQGYPMPHQLQQQQHPHTKQVVFVDQQQYPSPPDGYKSCDVTQPLLISTGPAGPPPPQQQHSGAPATQFMHQWPPCLPGYHHQQNLQQQQQQQQPAQMMPAKAAHHLHQATLASPTSSTSSSTTTQTSQTSTFQIQPASSSGSGSGVVGGKRCVGAQTLDPHDTIHEVQNEEAEAEAEAMAAETRDGHSGGDGAEDCGALASESRRPVAGKLKHLSGPLADSPDEGYVGDSQDGGSDM